MNRLSLVSAVAWSAAILALVPARAQAQLIGAITDVADIMKNDNDRFNKDLERVSQDYKKFKKAQDLIDVQTKRTVQLRKQTVALIASLRSEMAGFAGKRKGTPDQWGQDADAVKDRARYEALKKQIEALEGFDKNELENCIAAVKDAKAYTGTARVSGDIGTASGVDQGWNRVKERVNTTTTRCNEAAGRIKQIAADNRQVILALPPEPLKVENKSSKMVFFVMSDGGDGTKIGPNSFVRIPMPADRVLRLRAEAQTPMREKIVTLGKRGGKTISVETASQHELTYNMASGPASGRTSTRVTSESCSWKVSALSKKVGAMTATPMASKRYPALKDDAVAWTIPNEITVANFSKGISEPLNAIVTCNLEWVYERTGSGGIGSKNETTPESQGGAVTVWVMPQ